MGVGPHPKWTILVAVRLRWRIGRHWSIGRGLVRTFERQIKTCYSDLTFVLQKHLLLVGVVVLQVPNNLREIPTYERLFPPP